jgi:hypothetical protein
MWPPIWVGIGATKGKNPQGEVGHLKDVRCYANKLRRIFLTMEDEGAEYTGCLLFEDQLSCEWVAGVLQGHRGRLIEEIGSVELPPLSGVGIVYRKTTHNQTWHFCSNCSHWPLNNYEQQIMPPEIGELCNECKTLQLHRNCH